MKRRMVISGLISICLAAGIATPSGAYTRPGRTEKVSPNTFDPIAVSEKTAPPSTSISGDGRFVAFNSDDTTIGPVTAKTHLQENLYVFDRRTKTYKMESVDERGLPVVGDSQSPSLSASGRYLAFSSTAATLTSEADTNLTDDIFLRDRVPGHNILVSKSVSPLTDLGSSGNGQSTQPFVSATGRFVVFESAASDLVEGDTNGVTDVFLYDRKEDSVERVSNGLAGAEADGPSECASVTPDGRYVVFGSAAANLVKGDAKATGQAGLLDDGDVFLYDRKTKANELISVNSQGEQGNYPFWSGPDTCGQGSVSDDGRYVTFSAPSSNLVPNDGGALDQDIFVRDRQAERTIRVSVSSAGEEANATKGATISRDGRFATFVSTSSDLVDGDSAPCTETFEVPPENVGVPETSCFFGDMDVFIHDLRTGATEMITLDNTGKEATYGCGYLGLTSASGGISRDNRYVSFGSCSGSLVKDDTNEVFDAFVRDRGVELGAFSGSHEESDGELCLLDVCVPPVCTPAGCLPPNGLLRTKDEAGDLVTRETDLIEAGIVYRPELRDLYVSLDVVDMPNIVGPLAVGSPATIYGLRFSVDGKFYEVRATSLLGGTFGLFNCSGGGVCVKISDLKGGYGTTGERIVFSLPLDAIGLRDGGQLSNVEGFAGIGTDSAGVVKILDRVVFER